MKELKKEFEEKFVMMTGYQMILLKDEVEELFAWIEQKIDEACKKARIDELNKLQQTLNPYQMSENDFFRAMMDGTIKNTIFIRIKELESPSPKESDNG